MKRSIIITGGAGFIGNHVVRLFVNKYPNYKIINLDKLTYAGNLANLKDIEDKPIMKVKEESEKVGSKLNIQKMKIMASGPITSWGIDGGNSGNSVRLYFGGLQNHCRW